MPKQQVSTDRLRAPNGHFLQATMIEAKGHFVFISGMTARRPDGTIAGIGAIEAQTSQVCDKLKGAAEAAGGTLDDICRVDVYVRNMEPFDKVHKMRREYFKARRRHRPWSRTGIPGRFVAMARSIRRASAAIAPPP
jgi:2-iminobutanoate/2-iminopropanoate deaminase